MGLSSGCTAKADQFFANRHTKQMESAATQHNMLRSVILRIDNCTTHMNLTSVRGDCTACTAYLEGLRPSELPRMFTVIQEYMSINGRISCFFSLKKDKNTLLEYIKQIKKFPVAGLHIQKSNREPDSNMYMLTGILKVPNPIVNNYIAHDKEYPEKHNNNDTTSINALNKEFGLQTF